MKLYSAAQIKEWDRYTIEHEPISSLDLMERAARACTEWIVRRKLYEGSVRVFCGKGNNGGDGLAIARMLIEKDVVPVVYILEFGHKGTDEFQANLARLHRLTKDIHFIQSASTFPSIAATDIIIDALFGSGLNRPPEGLSAELIAHINAAPATVISIDLPSGMMIDQPSTGHAMIRADHTLTFQRLKRCLMVAENSPFFGEVCVLDIGLHTQYEEASSCDYYLTGIEEARRLHRPRPRFAHKGHFGHALLVGGTTGKSGAALIATEACLRSGAGLTSVYLLSDDYTALNSRCPEAMTLSGNDMVKKNLGRYTAIGLGPGMGSDDIALHLVTMMAGQVECPMVLDADALNILAAHPGWLRQLPQGTILTPHPKEFDRLFGPHAGSFERMDTALAYTADTGCIVVLKGPHTLVAAGGQGFFNASGNAGLAKGGSGDALTGVITALLAQGYVPAEAARLGVFLHGLAADLALEAQSAESMLASDVVHQLGNAFKMLSNVS